MLVSAIPKNRLYQNKFVQPASPEKEQKLPLAPEKSIDRSIYDKGSYNIPFAASTNILRNYLYPKSVLKHKNLADQIDPSVVKDYFNSLGIPYDMSGFSSEIQKVIGYCCFHTTEIYRQANLPLPVRLACEVADSPGIIGSCCYYRSGKFPLRTITFNMAHDWTNYIERFDDGGGHFSTGHFLHPFIHEYVHSMNNHQIYSKFGSPNPSPLYVYNPNVERILGPYNADIYDEYGNVAKNKYVSEEVRLALKSSSRYGEQLLPETVAEEITRGIVDCLDLMTLRLTKNPFPIHIQNSKLNQIVYEAWNGLINDGQGLI